MPGADQPLREDSGGWTQVRETLGRALASFLAVPTVVIILFVLLAGGMYALDQADIRWLTDFRDFMVKHVFGDAQATSNLLGTIAGGLITITSITFSLLLLALQQSAGSMSAQVFDQFLRRRLNQIYFGFFVGLALYALIILATISPSFNPVLGATLALLLTGVALYVLLLLIYSTISQMRPAEIIRAIHNHTLAAREGQLSLIARTRRSPSLPAIHSIPVRTKRDGFIVGLKLDAIAGAINQASGPVEVVLLRSIGAYVAYHDTMAEVRGASRDDAEAVASAVERAIVFDRLRRLESDPAFGIEQLATIGWRSISTAQQNPAPGLAAIRNLRDLLARWAAGEDEAKDDKARDEEIIAVVYPDNVLPSLFDAFEQLAIVASEAMQPQTYAEILRAFTITFPRLSDWQRRRVEDLLLRTLSALGDHVLSAELDDALTAIVHTLDEADAPVAADAIRSAQAELATTIGHLNSRSTRVPSAS